MSLEERLALSVPGIAGISLDSSGNVFVSYDSSTSSTQRQSIAELNSSGNLIQTTVVSQGSTARAGQLAAVGSSAGTLGVSSTASLFELQPNGELYVYDPSTGTASLYDDLGGDLLDASHSYNVQSASTVNLTGAVTLAGAVFGDLATYGGQLFVSAVSNGWDYVVRLSKSASGLTGTVLVASPIHANQATTPGGLAVDSAGVVLTTMPYLTSGSSSAIHAAVGFSGFFDAGQTPRPSVLSLGLGSVPNLESYGITVDSQDNFLLAMVDSSLHGGGAGVAHINGALDAFLADPTPSSSGTPGDIAYADVAGTGRLAITGTFSDASQDTYTIAGEIPLFSGQVTPEQLRSAYGIDDIRLTASDGSQVVGDGTGQTIAIVELGVDPTLEADLKTFDAYFGIADPPSFQIVNQNGVTTENLDIVGEASLDVEWAHAIAPGANIVVYNAAYLPNDSTTSLLNLLKAMNEASLLPGVSVVSLSYGIPESSLASIGLNETALDAYFTTPGVTFVVASGDSGIYGDGGNRVAANYPAASSNVVSVGGTSIVIDDEGDYPGTGSAGEVAWGTGSTSGTNGGSGGGLSSVETLPSWQQDALSSTIRSYNRRALPDVSIDSGSAQEYDVFTSTLAGSSTASSAVGWLGDAGTSAAAPIWAGLIAIANQGRVLAGGTPLTGNTQTLPALYSLPASDFHDIVLGSNGYAAATGYDLATGLGSPVANRLVPDLAAYGLGTQSVQVSLSASPSTPTIGQTVAITVRVASGSGTPTGQVTLTEDSTVIGTATLSQGVATFTITPGTAGTHGLTVSYGGSSTYRTGSAASLLEVAAATPAIAWVAPADITAGTALSGKQLNAIATFRGKTVEGVFTYTPAAGAVLAVGRGQTLTATFTPNDTTDFTSASASVLINVVARSTAASSTRLTVSSVGPVFKTKASTGRQVLAGFTLRFDSALAAAAAARAANYKLEILASAVVNGKRISVDKTLTDFKATYSASKHTVTLTLTHPHSFPQGGRLTVRSTVASGSGLKLRGNNVFKIAAGGKSVSASSSGA